MNNLVRAMSTMSGFGVTRSAYRMNIGGNIIGFHTSTAQALKLTATMSKSDAGQDKIKEDRRRKRLAKALKKMEKKSRQPKPLIELEIPVSLQTEAKARSRGYEVPYDVKEERHYFMKDWSKFSGDRHKNEVEELDRKVLSQQRALDELRNESLELYLEAVQIDPDLIPFKTTGPTQTPAIKDYIQDGEYHDITREYKVMYQDTESFLKTLISRKKKRKAAAVEED